MPTIKSYLFLCILLSLTTLFACNKGEQSDKSGHVITVESKTSTEDIAKKQQAELEKWAKIDPRVLNDSLVTADNAQMKAVGLKVRDGIFATFCHCYKETDPQKKKVCDTKLREFFEKMKTVASNPNATYEEFYREMTKDC